MKPRLLKRRPILVPTLLGWLVIFSVGATGVGGWALCGEDFLSVTNRRDADVLVVEAWIGMPGIAAAKEEFDRGGYKYLIAAGTYTNNRWGTQRYHYATLARGYLIRLGCPADAVIEAAIETPQAHRTFATAVAVRHALNARKVKPRGVNVLTVGMHARRTGVIFSRALGAELPVGTIAWTPSYHLDVPWWRSSEKAEDLIKESVAYPLELLFHSGRWWLGRPR